MPLWPSQRKCGYLLNQDSSGFFIVNFEHIWYYFLLFLKITLSNCDPVTHELKVLLFFTWSIYTTCRKKGESVYVLCILQYKYPWALQVLYPFILFISHFVRLKHALYCNVKCCTLSWTLLTSISNTILPSFSLPRLFYLL